MRKARIIIAFLTVAVLIFTGLPIRKPFGAETPGMSFEPSTDIYGSFLKSHKDAPRPDAGIVIDTDGLSQSEVFPSGKPLASSAPDFFPVPGDKFDKPPKDVIFNETLKIVKRLISEKTLIPSHYNGLAAHRAFADALLTREWDDNFEPYMCVMCTYKMYLDRQYAVKFFENNGRGDLADIYNEIAKLCGRLGEIIPQDFSAGDMFSDKTKLKPYYDTLLEICALEEKAVKLM
jgi:hypothetical protein